MPDPMKSADASRPRLPPLNALRAFEAAARHGSFKEAALELHVSQSAISHQVKGLEEALGVELFVRKTRAVELTPNGRIYYPVLREAFNRIADGAELIRTPAAAGVVTLQAYSTFTMRWLIPRLPGFQRAHPDIHLRLHTSQQDVDFDRSDVDACIMIGRPTHPELHYAHLFACELFPVCSPALLAGSRAPGSPKDLGTQVLLQVYPSAGDWRVWLDAHGVRNANPDAGLSFDSYDLALFAALQGMGVALGQQPYVSRELRSGLLVELFPGRRVANPNEWYFVCRKERKDYAKIDAVRSWLLAEVANDNDLLIGD
jgi:LysR family transcriptional regulator, glycine cleavage system transcriptional activator